MRHFDNITLKACSHYESNAHWKRINSHYLHSHWMRINCNSHWTHIQSIHFHRWFEANLKVNCIMTWNNVDLIFSCLIGCVKKQGIRQEITGVTLLLHLGNLLYLLCHVQWGFVRAVALLLSPLNSMLRFSAKLMLCIKNKEAMLQFSCIITS